MRGTVALVLIALLSVPAGLLAGQDAAAEPTPGIACQAAAAGAPLPRIVPEPEQTNDYLGFAEAVECLEAIEAAAPDRVEIIEIGESAGWEGVNGRVASPILVVEVTNEKSAVPFEDRLKHIFQLSVHGNEKGGREGGLRVIEDLARCLDTPGAITAEHPELCGYLDYMVAVFTFPNPDGWRHEEPEVLAANPATLGAFTRENANGYDLNRQWPNRGWTQAAYQTLSQPEIQASAAFLKTYTNVATATDIHGMLQPTDADPGGELAELANDMDYAPGGSLLEGLLDAGKADPVRMLKTTRMAELLKERVNADPNLIAWNGAPATGLWGGQVMEWGTSWDTIGYVDSGFTGDFFFQEHGLNATAMDFEMAYNHIVCDNHYAACGQATNLLHVRLVRQIVAVFMESTTREVQLSLETGGARTAWLYNPLVVTSTDANGTTDVLEGWALENDADDAYDYAHTPFEADPNEFFWDLRPYLRDGDKPGLLQPLRANELDAANLGRYDTLVVGGSAYRTIQGHPDRLAGLTAWVEAGGTLVLTDSALRFLEDSGLAQPETTNVVLAYAGHTDFLDRGHPLAAGLRGIARQTYEGVPLGYAPGQAPIWYVEPSAAASLDADVVGTVGGGGGGTDLVVATTEDQSGRPNYGEIPLGEGRIRFLGALLPDPTEEFYHPYGLDAYATTYTGNQLLHNMLGWTTVYSEPPIVVEDLGKARGLGNGSAQPADAERDAGKSPGFAAIVTVGVLVAALSVSRRLARRG